MNALSQPSPNTSRSSSPIRTSSFNFKGGSKQARPQIPYRTSSFNKYNKPRSRNNSSESFIKSNSKPPSRSNSFKRNASLSRSVPNSPNSSSRFDAQVVDLTNVDFSLRKTPSRSASGTSLSSFGRRMQGSPERESNKFFFSKAYRWFCRTKNASYVFIFFLLVLSGRSFIEFYIKATSSSFEGGLEAEGYIHRPKATKRSKRPAQGNKQVGRLEDVPKNRNNAVPVDPDSYIAYAWMLGGLPSPSDGDPFLPEALSNVRHNITKDVYRGLVYNILVSVKILRDSGSRADMVVLVHMAQGNEELAPEDARLFHEMDIQVKYIPPTPNVINEFSTIALEKFRILDLTDYDRVLYMDADTTPLCNLDYIMELSLGDKPKLHENFIVSIGDTPVSASFFMLQPGHGEFQELLEHVANWPYRRNSFDNRGWGDYGGYKSITSDGWRTLSGKTGHAWVFEGADSDQGLLLFWTKYMKKSVSHAIGDEVEMWSGGKMYKVVKNNPLGRPYSCLKKPAEWGGTGKLWFKSEAMRKKYSPLGVAPYRDFAQWQWDEYQPWHYPQAPAAVNSTEQVMTARKFWFHTLRQLDESLSMGLGFKHDPDGVNPNEKRDGEPNWRYVQKRVSKTMNPVWSARAQSLQQWALREVNTSMASMRWEAPILRQRVNETSASFLRSKCHCPESISSDPCSSSTEKLEDWLGRRIPFHLSKHRPLCPDALKHHMHVVLPFHELNSKALEASTCSVICQDYPPDKMSIYLYDDGSSNNSMVDLCQKDYLIEFQPLQGGGETGDTDSDSNDDFDVYAKKLASDTIERLQKKWENPSDAPSTTCIQSKNHLGPGGATYWAFRLVEAAADPNDIVVVLDVDDELLNEKALETVNRKYVQTGAFTTFGSYEGKYSEQTVGLPNSILSGKTFFAPRQSQPSWRFGHARTFKAHLLGHIGRSDFLDKDKSWLVKAFDRGFVYRMLELSGVKRIAFIPEKIYKYWSSTGADIRRSHQSAQLDHVQSLKPSKPLTLPIHVVMTCGDHVVLLEKQLGWLQGQSMAKSRQIHVHLLNNNPGAQEEIEATVEKFREEKPEKGNPLDVTVVKNEHNWHTYSRFLYVNELRKKEPLDRVIFLSDDQYWTPFFFESILDRHKPASMTTWFGKVFENRDPVTGWTSFENSSLTWDDIIAERKTSHSTLAYGDPSGSVFDGNLWLFDKQLLRLQGDMKHYYKSEDVWVSYVLDALLGWNILRQKVRIPIEIAKCGHEIFNKTVFPRLPVGHAEELLELSSVTAERVAAIKTDSEETKSQMFDEMQSRFHWNVMRLGSKPAREVIKPEYVVPKAPFSKYSEGEKAKRAFVCVTGQFDRFELKMKIRNILLPIMDVGVKVDVALVLSAGEAVFTNAKATKFAPFYTKFEDAVNDLQSNNIRVLSLNGTYDRIEKPHVNMKYYSMLYENQKAWRNETEQYARVQNHGRIFESYLRCLDYADGAAQEEGMTLEEYYDVVIRIRDDVALNKKLKGDLRATLIPPPPNSLTVTECRAWHGMNDRFAIVSPDIAREYFERPYAIFTNNTFVDPKIVRNPETFLLYSYTTAKMSLLGHPDLKRINRVVNYGDGKPEYYDKDKLDARCPEADTHVNRRYDLYGWVF